MLGGQCIFSNRNGRRFKKQKSVCISKYFQIGVFAGKRVALVWSGRFIWGKLDRQVEGIGEEFSFVRWRDKFVCFKGRLWEGMIVGRRQVRECKEEKIQRLERKKLVEEVNFQLEIDLGSRERLIYRGWEEVFLGIVDQLVILGE